METQKNGQATKRRKGSNPMRTAKIDVDVKMDDELMRKFLITRKALIYVLGYTYIDHTITPTEKGYHFWFNIKEDINDKDLCDLQFLLGDDQVRSRFNYLRLEAGCFNQFNCLFSRKFKGEKQT